MWRGELAQHIESYLAESLTREELTDWAMDHPFFDDRADLDEIDQRVLAMGLGTVLQLDPSEPPASRTSPEQLRLIVSALWRESPPRNSQELA